MIVGAAAPDVRSAFQTRLVHFGGQRRPYLAVEIRAFDGGSATPSSEWTRHVRDWLRAAPGSGRLADRMEYDSGAKRHNEVVHTLATQGLSVSSPGCAGRNGRAGLRKAAPARSMTPRRLLHRCKSSCLWRAFTFELPRWSEPVRWHVCSLASSRHWPGKNKRLKPVPAQGLSVLGIATSIAILGWIGVLRPFWPTSSAEALGWQV